MTEKRITAIAVDDEPIALDIICKHADKVPFMDLRAVFSSATAALAYLQEHDVDVVFLDIAMPDLSGLEFAQAVRQKIQIIFTTAYPEFAVKGFDMSATDYLLKPIGLPRFLEACVKANQAPAARQHTADHDRHLFVKDGYDWIRITLDDILFIAADDNYVTFYETAKKTIARMTIAAALDKLSDRRFMRVHKSFIISLPKVEKLEPHQVVIASHKIPVSASYREALMKALV